MRLPNGTYSVQGIVRWGLDEDARGAGPSSSFYVVGRPWVYGTADLEAKFEVSGGRLAGAAPSDVSERTVSE
jgi:hypothetical protein